MEIVFEVSLWLVWDLDVLGHEVHVLKIIGHMMNFDLIFYQLQGMDHGWDKSYMLFEGFCEGV